MTENLHNFTEGAPLNERAWDGRDTKEYLEDRIRGQRMDAEALLANLQQERERQLDFIADTRTLNMVPINAEVKDQFPKVEEQERLTPTAPQVAIIPKTNEDWYAATGPVVPNSHAHEQIGAQLKIPRAYYKRMLDEAPDLLALNVNNWLEAAPARRMFRVTKEQNIGVARAYLSDRYRRLDNLELAEAFVPMFLNDATGWEIQQCGLTSLRMHIEAVYPTLSGEVVVGDTVALAVKITSSEVGSGALSVQLGFHRVVCSNLAVVPSYSQRQIHLGRAQDEMLALLSDETIKREDQLIIDKMRDVVHNMADIENFQAMMNTLKDSAAAKLDDPIRATEILINNLNLTENEGHLVQNNLLESGLPNMWGLTNALTAAARNLDMERKAELEIAAGRILEDGKGWKQYVQAA